MKKIIIALLGMCLCFALMGCGGSGNSYYDPYLPYKDYKLFEKDVPLVYSDEAEEYFGHTWKGETVESPYGTAKKIEVGEEDSYAYLNDGKSVYYGFPNEGSYEFVKVYETGKTEIGDTWESEGITCTVIDKDELFRLYTVKMRENDSGASLVYDYSEFFGVMYNVRDSKMKIIVIKDHKFLQYMLDMIKKIKKIKKR